MQYFDDRSREERGEALIREMEYALSNESKSGTKLNEVFNEATWKESFRNSFAKFGVSEGYEKKLFK